MYLNVAWSLIKCIRVQTCRSQRDKYEKTITAAL